MATPGKPIHKVSIFCSAESSKPQDWLPALVIALRAASGPISTVVSGEDNAVSPRTKPEGAATLGLAEIAILLGSGAGLSVLQQVSAVLVEWIKARRQSSASIEVDGVKISVSGSSHPEDIARKLYAAITSSPPRPEATESRDE